MAKGRARVNGVPVVIGVPSYNHAGDVREAIESILAQSYRNLGVVVVDDCSDDGTFEELEAYARRDSRLQCIRNERRVGMIENWRRAFFEATRRFPDAKFFAWGSDHDVWHPHWLKRLLEALEANDDVVLAYPLSTKILVDGLVARKPWRFDTYGDERPFRRLRRASWDMSAGNMVYGLFRVDAMKTAGVFRRILVPDRMLLAELCLQGQFQQVQEVLWFRRWYGRIFSLGRQRRSFFPDGRPAYAYVPWWISHGVALGWNIGVRGVARPVVSRPAGVAIGVWYLLFAGALHVVQQIRALRLWLLGWVPTLRGTRRRTINGIWRFAKRIRKVYRVARRDGAIATRRAVTTARRAVRVIRP